MYKESIDYTFFYIVGGAEIYYEQLQKSIRSLSRLNIKYKVKILDIGKKLKNQDNVEIFYIDKDIDKKHIYWQYKYYICQKLDTKYGIYLDCDTIVCSDQIEKIFNKIQDKFGVIQHFHLINFKTFLEIFKSQSSYNYIINNSISLDSPFFTAGVFFFNNNENSFNILKEVFDLHNNYYSNNSEYIEGLYDETFLSTVLSKYDYENINGSSNHCCANHMPLKLIDNKLFGKNPFDESFEEIFIFHGYSLRQVNALDYEGELQNKIRQKWDI
jgi:hypothetical protein